MFVPRGYRHLGRYREIASVLIKHGFGDVVDRIGLAAYLSLPRRLFRRGQEAEAPPGLTAPQRVRLALEELGPTFIKLGQILSTRPDLVPPDVITELSRLQDTVPPAPWERVQAQIEAELGGSIESLFAAFDPTPIAAASLAQVHAATLPDGREVVVKVQRPDIEKTIDSDLDILNELAGLIQEHTSLGQLYDLRAIAEDFGYTLRAELDYQREGRNADRFRRNFAGESHLYIPQIHWDYSTRRVLVMERISGVKIDDLEGLEAAGYDRRWVALQSARIIIKEVLEDGFFHADPHPGNFVVLPGEAIGAMDFGMVGQLNDRDRLDLVRLYVIVVQLDAAKIVDQLIEMGVAHPRVERQVLARDIDRLLTRYSDLPLEEVRVREVWEEVMPIAFRHHLQLRGDLWLLGKTLAMLEGLGLKLDPGFDVFAVSRPHVRRLQAQLLTPTTWGPPAIKTLTDWATLLTKLPDVGPRLLDQAERGELQLLISFKEVQAIINNLDRMVNRLALSVLVAAFIVGLAWLVSAFDLARGGGLALVLVVGGLGVAFFLGLWLTISILRAGR